MVLEILNRYWILYGMFGVCAAGVLSRIWLDFIYKGLLRDMKNVDNPKKKLLKQLKNKYESYSLMNMSINNMNAFIKKNLYSQKFFGMTIDGLKRVSGQALFLCVLAGGIAAFLAYRFRASQELVTVHIVGALGCAAVIMDMTWLLNAGRKQEIVEAGLADYLENGLAVKAEKTKKQREGFSSRSSRSQPPREEISHVKKSFEQIAANSEKRQDEKEYVPSKKDGEVVEEIIHRFLG